MFSGGCAGEGEIEQDKTQTAAAAGRCNTDIVGLDIAMGDALFFEVIDCLKQILAKPPHHVERQQVIRVVAPQAFCQRAVSGPFHQDGLTAGDGQRLDNSHDVWMAQRSQHGSFGPDTIAMRLVDGDLQDEFFFFAITAHQQCIRGAATTELADNYERRRRAESSRFATLGSTVVAESCARVSVSARARYSRNSPADAIRSLGIGAVDARTMS